MQERKLSNQDLSHFREYLIYAERSTATIEKYCSDLYRFMEYVDGDNVTKETVISYKQYLIEEYAINSVNSIIAGLNCFFGFIGWYDCRIKAIKQQRQIFCNKDMELTRAEYMRLLAAAKRRNNDRLNLILQTICGTGIRVSELEYITVEAAEAGEATVDCKGKIRTVFIINDLKKKLLNYAKDRHIETGSIFITRNGKPISRSNIWREMKALCKDANVNPKKVFPHNLRKLFARTFYGIEKDIAKLADILGHNSINTTRIYIISSGTEHRRRMEKMKLII